MATFHHIVILMAAGRGKRFGSNTPKQYTNLGNNSSILTTTLDQVIAKSTCDAVLPVIGVDDDRAFMKAVKACEQFDSKTLLAPVVGGETRFASVYNGLSALHERSLIQENTIVSIHDAARPFTPPALWNELLGALHAEENLTGIAPGTPSTDTIHQIDDAGHVTQFLPRATLRAVQTPQIFRFDNIWDAYQQASHTAHYPFSDDVSVAFHAGHSIKIIEGSKANIKITYPEDIA